MVKLPRWLIWSLLTASALAVLAVPASLWIEMPRRTAEKFVQLVEARQVDQANELLKGARCELREYQGTATHVAIRLPDGIAVNITTYPLELTDRSARDILTGHQQIVLENRFAVTFVASWRDVTTDGVAYFAKIIELQQRERDLVNQVKAARQRLPSPK